MMNTDSPLESTDPCLLPLLPEDIFAVISRFLSPIDICNLILCSKSLNELVDSDKIWLAQCEVIKILPLLELLQWRIGISSYKLLCRFLVKVMEPLVGIWVHQNPELGNVVYVMPGFLSVVACRIIPQEVGSIGIQEGRVLWSPVFEIICGFDGGTEFFLHGREGECDCLYPGFVMDIEKNCNVVLLEVEPSRKTIFCSENEDIFSGKDEVRFSFGKLAFGYRRKLLDLVTARVGLSVPELSSGKLFPMSKDDIAVLLERRTMLLKMHKFGGNWNYMNLEDELCSDAIRVDITELWKNLGYADENLGYDTQKKSFRNYFKSRIKHILRRSSPSSSNTASSSSGNRYSNLQNFLSSGDSVGLSLKGLNSKVSTYRSWPNMDETRYALYKLPITKTVPSQEYAGLWGGTFGWPPGKITEDKPGRALFLLNLTYEESQDDSERLLVATKVLEGTHYVTHPNGSTMFVVKIDSPSYELFPLDTNGEEFENCYTGEGIARGYGFRYPGYKPGSLFATSKGLLMFVWKESEVVLTLERLNLDEMLKNGLFVQPLSPCLNFTYLIKSHTNVFAPGQRTS